MHRSSRHMIGTSALLLVLYLTPAGAQFADAQIIVGVSAPINTSLGKELADGARLAAEQINEHGGVFGKKIELIIKDDACNPAQAIAMTQELIERDKAAAVIGYPCAAAALAARSVAMRSKTLMIALASEPALTTKEFNYVLRPIGREDHLATTAATYLKANFSGRKIGAILPEARFGIGASLRAATQVVFPLQQIETPKPDPKDFNLVNSVEILVTAGIAPLLVDRIVREYNKLSVVMVTNVVSEEHSAVLAASKRAVAIANPNERLLSGAKSAVESARKQNIAATGYFIYAYAGVQIFASLANKVGNTSVDALTELARKEPVSSVLGPQKFDNSGDLVDWHFAVFSDGPEGSVKPLEISAVDLCKTDQCAQLSYCNTPCPNK